MKNKKFNTSDLFSDNRFLMIFSVVVAVIIWLIVAVEFSPEVTVTVKQIPVTIDYSTINKSFGLDAFGETQFTVDVTVKGKKIVVEADDIADDIIVTANTNYVNSVGNYSLHLNCDSVSARPEYEIVSLSSDDIDVYFDYTKQKEFAVVPEIDFNGDIVPEGYMTGEFVYPESNVIKVSGPESEVNKIQNIAAYVALKEQLHQNTTLEATLFADTVDGSALRYVTFDKQNDQIHITVPVYKKAKLRTVCSFINKPSDYVESVPFAVTVSPAEAMFGIPENKLDGMTGFEIASIDFLKLDSGVNVFKIPAEEISGGTVADGTKEFTVRVDLSSMGKKTFEIPEKIGFINGTDDINAEVSDLSFTEVTVVGPKDKIELLTAEDIILNADLRNITEISDEPIDVPVTFADPSCWLLGEYTAKVIIK